MRARSHTELDSRQHLVPLKTCSPSQNELHITHQRTGHISWIKRYLYINIRIQICCLFSSPLI